MKNQQVVVTIGVALLVFIAFVYYITSVYLPGENRKIEQQYAAQYATEEVYVVNNMEGIDKNTPITEDLFESNKIIKEARPIKYLPYDENGQLLIYKASEKENMINKKVNRLINKGEYILKECLNDGNYPDDQQFVRKSEYTLKNSVAGEIKSGKWIDVILDYGDGDYDVVVPKIKVLKVVGEEAAAQAAQQAAAQGNTPAPVAIPKEITVVLGLNETQFRDMELAKKLGTFRARLYNSENQAPSVQTFDYKVMSDKVIDTAIQQKLLGEIASYGNNVFLGFINDKSGILAKLNDQLFRFKQQEADKLQKLKNDVQAAPSTKNR